MEKEDEVGLNLCERRNVPPSITFHMSTLKQDVGVSTLQLGTFKAIKQMRVTWSNLILSASFIVISHNIVALRATGNFAIRDTLVRERESVLLSLTPGVIPPLGL